MGQGASRQPLNHGPAAGAEAVGGVGEASLTRQALTGPVVQSIHGAAAALQGRTAPVGVSAGRPRLRPMEWGRETPLGSERLPRDPQEENLFARLKDWRPIATCCDRCAHHIFLSVLLLAATVSFIFR